MADEINVLSQTQPRKPFIESERAPLPMSTLSLDPISPSIPYRTENGLHLEEAKIVPLKRTEVRAWKDSTCILSPLAWACYNVSSVFSNAFLPIYVRAHPKVLEAVERATACRIMHEIDEKNEIHSIDDNDYGSGNVDCRVGSHSNNSGSTQPGQALTTPMDTDAPVFSTTEQRKVEEQVSNDLSAWCTVASNVGSVVVQGVCIGISIGMVLGFANPIVLRANPSDFKTLRSMRQLSQVTKFIFAWFILSDGVNTVTSLLYVITYQDLNFSHTKSLVMTILVSIMAFVGAYLFLFIRQYWKLSTKFMIMLTLGLYALLTAYFVTPSYFTTQFGLRHEWEVWVSVVYLGLIISTFYGVARVMVAELCPKGDENEWFSLFQLADKGSSWIGPFVTGAIQSITGEFRTGFWFPLALFVVGAVLLITVDVNKGKDEAIAYVKSEETKRQLSLPIPSVTITTTAENATHHETHKGRF
ncbi:hypothetical protein BGX20_004203 [Mortierella sp. AD010]|nr:hypothetical protein BGX20_004203 [Mortierella sp. AD010]